jgi:hypothetical protein
MKQITIYDLSIVEEYSAKFIPFSETYDSSRMTEHALKSEMQNRV